jgi:ADP-L-glycero-D-manno-heptose 6-epimerase
MRKNILITGGAGFIGSSLAFEIQKRFPQSRITIFDKFNNRERRENGNFKYFGDYKNLIGLKAEVISGDLSNKNDVNELLRNKYDIIFHQGAISDTTVLNQEEMLQTNAMSLKYFIDYCLKNNCKLIYASSAGTYGNSSSPNIVDFGEIPENVYGYSKLQMDEITRSYLDSNHKLHIVGLRYFNVYGPREIYKRSTSSMILQIAKQVLEKKSVRLFKYGEQSRDFVYIKDVIEANILAIEGKNGIYNVGTGVSRSFNDIIKILEGNLQTTINIEYFDNPYLFYQNNTCADLTNSKAGLGYIPQYSLEQGISEYMLEILNYSSTNWNSFNE